MHADTPGARVFCHVVEGFLRNTVHRHLNRFGAVCLAINFQLIVSRCASLCGVNQMRQEFAEIRGFDGQRTQFIEQRPHFRKRTARQAGQLIEIVFDNGFAAIPQQRQCLGNHCR